MSNQENPTAGATNAGTQVYRQGPEVPNPLKPWMARPSITLDMPGPAGLEDCTFVARHTHVEFLVVPAPNATTYDIVYGRWVKSKKSGARGLDHWLQLGVKSVTVATEPVGRVQFEVNTDAVAAYITAINPSPGTGEGFLMFYRGVSGVTGSNDT